MNMNISSEPRDKEGSYLVMRIIHHFRSAICLDPPKIIPIDKVQSFDKDSNFSIPSFFTLGPKSFFFSLSFSLCLSIRQPLPSYPSLDNRFPFIFLDGDPFKVPVHLDWYNQIPHRERKRNLSSHPAPHNQPHVWLFDIL